MALNSKEIHAIYDSYPRRRRSFQEWLDSRGLIVRFVVVVVGAVVGLYALWLVFRLVAMAIFVLAPIFSSPFWRWYG